MSSIALYPLRFAPIYEYRIWGGRHLADWLTAPLPGDESIGEAWLLSDRDDHPSVVADGPLKGQKLAQLIEEWPERIWGKLVGQFCRFPLLLKFLDVRETLSVQVHPSDQQTDFLPAGETGKTEAWVVLDAGPKSRIYAGLKPESTSTLLRETLTNGKVESLLYSFTPKSGGVVLIPAGTVHSLSHVVVFEVQQNSDVTFRLFDWNHVDSKTGQPRPLQVEQAMACIDFEQGAINPVVPVVEEKIPLLRERLISCAYFEVWRWIGEATFTVGATAEPRVLVCIGGEGCLEYDGSQYAFGKGDVLLLPAVVGKCVCRPSGVITMLEISIPGRRQTS